MIAKLDTRTLSNTPQKWGVFPSLWFWRRMNLELSRRTSLMLEGVSLVQGVTLFFFINVWLDVTEWGKLGLVAASVGFYLLQLGLLERWLRKKVKQRALTATAEDDSLGLQRSLAESQAAALISASVPNPSPSGSAT